MPMPQVGDVAPDFTLMDQDGNTVRLSDHRGRNVVLYFYPRDNTPGCTVEACAFRDEYGVLSEANTVVLGVSPDDARSHQRFIEKFSLPFPLLVDTDHQTAEAYGVWVEKNMYGKKSMGIQRATFLVGPDGKLAQVWPRVKVEGHAAEVKAALRGAGAGESASAGAGDVAGTRRTTASPARKSAARKTAVKKAATKKTAARRAPAKKAAAKKTGAGRSGTASREAPRRAEGSANPQHKTRVVAKRGTMKPGRNAPAGGAGAARRGGSRGTSSR